MTVQYRQQLQEQHQEVPAATPAAAAPQTPASVSDDIAAFLKDEPAALGGEDTAELDDGAGDYPALAQVPDDDEADEGAETTETPAEAQGVDVAKLTAALKAEDLPAFIEALGPAADKLLTSKAHKALRIAARDLTKQKAAVVEAQAQATTLTDKLVEKYSDPIEIRKATVANSPDAVDKFIDYAEKTVGADWNAIMQWVAKGLAGRPERLAAKAKAATTATETQTTAQKAALVQTQTWVTAEVTKTDPEMLKDAPEIVDLVIDEIRKGYAAGITTPAKALPLVLKKLEAQHARLAKLLARKGGKKPKVEAAPAPAARVGKRADADATRPRTLEEDIAWTKKEMGVK